MSTVFPASRRAAIRSSRSEEAGSHRPRRDRLELRCHQNAAQGNQVQACAPAATSLWREPAGQHAVALLGTHIVTKGKAPNSNERAGAHFRRRRLSWSGHRQSLP
eukprot:scaffold51160_cov78-Phaeocystis_antarctica.AAC.6